MEITAEALDRLIKCSTYHERAPDWGERAWMARGQNADVLYGDTGNSWCDIMHVFPKKEERSLEWLKWFLAQVIVFDEDDNEWWAENLCEDTGNDQK